MYFLLTCCIDLPTYFGCVLLANNTDPPFVLESLRWIVEFLQASVTKHVLKPKKVRGYATKGPI